MSCNACAKSAKSELTWADPAGKTWRVWSHDETVEQLKLQKDVPADVVHWADSTVRAMDDDDEEHPPRLADEDDDETQDIRERLVPMTLTKEMRDRDNDIISVRGLDVTSFRKDNPVLLFAHNARELPIGRMFGVKKILNDGADRRRVIGDAGFLNRDLSKLGDTIFRLMTMRPRVLAMGSIGFRTMKAEIDRELMDDEGLFGVLFEKTELLEFSIVPVGSNPGALAGARSFGVDLDPLKSYLEEQLDEHQHESFARWITAKDLEACYTVCNNGARTFLAPNQKTATSDDVALTQRLLEVEEEGGLMELRYDDKGVIVGLNFEAGDGVLKDGTPAPREPSQAKAGTSGDGAPAKPKGAAGASSNGKGDGDDDDMTIISVAGKEYRVPFGYELKAVGDTILIAPNKLMLDAATKDPPPVEPKANGDDGSGQKKVDDDEFVIELVADDPEDDGAQKKVAKTDEEKALEAVAVLVTQTIDAAIDKRTGRLPS